MKHYMYIMNEHGQTNKFGGIWFRAIGKKSTAGFIVQPTHV